MYPQSPQRGLTAGLPTWVLGNHTQLPRDTARVRLWPRFLHLHNEKTAFIFQASVLETARSILLLIQVLRQLPGERECPQEGLLEKQYRVVKVQSTSFCKNVLLSFSPQSGQPNSAVTRASQIPNAAA